jgi:ABC-type Zn uptake system ZnuABC Zn-binding protein ZnuA
MEIIITNEIEGIELGDLVIYKGIGDAEWVYAFIIKNNNSTSYPYTVVDANTFVELNAYSSLSAINQSTARFKKIGKITRLEV